MPIVIRERKGLARVVVVCDHCGKDIKFAKSGNYQWVMDDEEDDKVVFFTHKRCCLSFDQAWSEKGKRLRAVELIDFPFYLCNNLELDFEDSKRHAVLMHEFFGVGEE